MGDLGLPGSVVEIADAAWQRDVWEVRKAGLNIMMSMKGDGKPVSFIEDCAVPLEHLAEYTERLTQRVREARHARHVLRARVGRLPARAPRAEHAHASTARGRCARSPRKRARSSRNTRAAYSGEHGDGLVRSEWIEPVYGARLTRAFGEIKQAFDPKGLMNPGKIVAAPKMDDRQLFRFKPDYRTAPLARRGSTGPSTKSARRTAAAASRPPSRCATTTATAASSTRARCARPTA